MHGRSHISAGNGPFALFGTLLLQYWALAACTTKCYSRLLCNEQNLESLRHDDVSYQQLCEDVLSLNTPPARGMPLIKEPQLDV